MDSLCQTPSTPTKGRETTGSRSGFLPMGAGCAVGLENIWKFPYMVGEYGGGAFVPIHLLFLFLMPSRFR